MSVAFYMAELTTPDPGPLVSWYVAALGLSVTLSDPAGGFTLLEAPGGGRIAIKSGEAGRATLHFRVDDLGLAAERLRAAGTAPGAAKTSAEGYTRLRVADSGGNQVVLFAWEESAPPAPPKPPRARS